MSNKNNALVNVIASSACKSSTILDSFGIENIHPVIENGANEQTYEDWKNRMQDILSDMVDKNFDDFFATPLDSEWNDIAGECNSDPKVVGIIHPDFAVISDEYAQKTGLELIWRNTKQYVDGGEFNTVVFIARAK